VARCGKSPIPSICCHCGSPLEPKSAIGVEKRQVFDLPERPLVVTENQASIYRCAHCRGETKAAFPEGVVSPTQHGELIKAAAIYLNIQQLIPEDRTAQALSDLFAAPLMWFVASKLNYDLVPMVVAQYPDYQIILKKNGTRRVTSVEKHIEFIHKRIKSSELLPGRVRFNDCVGLMKWSRFIRGPEMNEDHSGLLGEHVAVDRRHLDAIWPQHPDQRIHLLAGHQKVARDRGLAPAGRLKVDGVRCPHGADGRDLHAALGDRIAPRHAKLIDAAVGLSLHPDAGPFALLKTLDFGTGTNTDNVRYDAAASLSTWAMGSARLERWAWSTR
jgi:hypothetical protein